nr:MAG TPA: hypothetical protein [Caudoviricetes sp.]
MNSLQSGVYKYIYYAQKSFDKQICLLIKIIMLLVKITTKRES